MRGYISILCVGYGLLLTACSAAHGPIGFWSRNRVDRQGERHGPWRTYHDAEEQKVATQTHFRHGRQVGRITYYTAAGQLVEREWLRRHPTGFVRIRYYYPNGRTLRKGQARYVNEPSGPHFYWFGNWTLYDSAGRAVKMETYESGKLVRTVEIAAKQQDAIIR